MTTRPPVLLLLMVGFTVWSIAFVGLYALQSIGCAAGWQAVTLGPVSLLRTVMVAAFVLSLAALAVTALVLRRRGSGSGEFVAVASYQAALAAAAAGVFTFAPVLFTTACS